MKIAAIFIATAFEVRLRNKEGSFLKQHERFRMAEMLDEFSRWMSESVHSPELLVVTCFDEIYELCIRRHIKVVRNEFGQISESNMIRTGMLEMQGYDHYIVFSASEPRLIKAPLLEKLCEQYQGQSYKTIVTKYKNKLQLPVVLAVKNSDALNDMTDKDKGRLSIKPGLKNVVQLEVTDEFLGSADKDRKVKDYLSGVSRSLTGEETVADVVVIRGGGRIGSGIALSLHSSGRRVLITEKEEPETLFREMSFAGAVKNTEVNVNGVSGYLVSPGIRQFEKAWNAGVIPVVIDPDFSSVGLFSRGGDAKGAFAELDDPSDKTEKTYRLAAVIDCSPDRSGVAFPEVSDILTVGLKGNDYGSSGPKYVLCTAFNSRYAIADVNREIKVRHVDVQDGGFDEQDDEIVEMTADIYRYIKASSEGKFRVIKRIGDYVKVNEMIGQIVDRNGDRTDVFSSVSGRIAGSKAENAICKGNEKICVIDPAAKSADDCFSQSPLSMLPGSSVLQLLLSKKD